MLGWLTGSSRPPDIQGNANDEGPSFADNEPATPAPQFAIRALKSALLGTPHVTQVFPLGDKEQLPADAARSDTHRDNQKSRISKPKHPPSPTKGILVTPGTGANKRKTVSFGNLVSKAKDGANDLFTGGSPRPRTSSATQAGTSLTEAREATLTKSRFEEQLEDSKRRMSKQGARAKLGTGEIASLVQDEDTGSTAQACIMPQMPDTTTDLNLPCSMSGKHWKGEYEQYHKKSNRELKRIIQHGQIIKTYAQKRDSEATSLNEKLRHELAKVAVMEAKVSELAAELANARAHGNTTQGHPANIMSDLAKQTTLAIRYKQRAERYKAALNEQEQSSANSEQADDIICVTLEGDPTTSISPKARGSVDLCDDMERLRSTVEVAEEKASRLQHENTTLKQKMTRVKDEMKNYEARRLAREERLRRREAKLTSAKQSCEAKLVSLTLEHERLLRARGKVVNMYQSDPSPGAITRDTVNNSKEQAKDSAKALASASCILDEEEGSRDAFGGLQERRAVLASRGKEYRRTGSSSGVQESRNSRRLMTSMHHAHESTFGKYGVQIGRTEQGASPVPLAANESSTDIWTQQAQESLVDESLPNAETPKDSGFSMLRRETHDALQEIDQNKLPNQDAQSGDPPASKLKGDFDPDSRILEPKPKPALSSAVRRMHSRRSTIASPRPSLLNFASSPIKVATCHGRRDSTNTRDDRPSTMLSLGSITPPMGSKGGRLPPERAEAARKRLEARRGRRDRR